MTKMVETDKIATPNTHIYTTARFPGLVYAFQ